MKCIPIFCALLLLCGSVGCNKSTDQAVLDAIRQVKPGTNAAEVSAILGKSSPDDIFAANSAPAWIKDTTAHKPTDGEYYIYTFLKPFSPKILIVYITPESVVGFVTWTPT